MLVSAAEMLKKAKAGHYAVGQFNINNLEWTKAILTAAEETKSPVILGVSEGAGKYMAGYKTVVGMVNGMLEEMKITVPVALHLDHGTYEGCQKCMKQDSLPLCLMVLIIRLRRMWLKQKNLRQSARKKECLWRQRSDLLAARKTELSER